MDSRNAAQQADRLSRSRARTLPFLAVIYLAQQASFFSALGEHRTVDHVKIGAWLVLSFVILMALVTKGFWFHSRQVRELVDDENTRANRLQATQAGFIAAMLGAMLAYLLAGIAPMNGIETVHIILTLGLGAALVRFGWLERRAIGND